MLKKFKIFNKSLNHLDKGKLLINTINAYSYVVALKDVEFNEALLNSNVLIPDGISIVWAIKLLKNKKIKKIAGADLFFYEMNRLDEIKGKCFFLGSTNETLKKIKKRANKEFPNVKIDYFSPPYKPNFSEEDNELMISKINYFKPDVLFIGMTAPKQEKWAYFNFNKLNVGHVCSIGAVFDFYAGTIKRAPKWMIDIGLEWLYRLIKEPKRMWRRYIIGNTLFILSIFKEKFIS